VKSIPFVDGIPDSTVINVPLREIDLDDNEFEFRVDHKIKDLVEDIQANGQQFPVILRRLADGRLQLVSGFRRCRALSALGWPTVKAIIREDLDTDRAYQISFMENEKRKSLTGRDKANAIAKLKRLGKSDADVQKIFGIGRRQIQRYKKLTTFPKEILEGLEEGAIDTTHALEIMRVHGRQSGALDLSYWIERVFQEDLSVRKLVRELNARYGKPVGKKRYLEKYKDGGFRLFPMRFDPKTTSAEARQLMASRLRQALERLEGDKPGN